MRDLDDRSYPKPLAMLGKVLQQQFEVYLRDWQMAFINTMEGQYPPLAAVCEELASAYQLSGVHPLAGVAPQVMEVCLVREIASLAPRAGC